MDRPRWKLEKLTSIWNEWFRHEKEGTTKKLGTRQKKVRSINLAEATRRKQNHKDKARARRKSTRAMKQRVRRQD